MLWANISCGLHGLTAFANLRGMQGTQSTAAKHDTPWLLMKPEAPIQLPSSTDYLCMKARAVQSTLLLLQVVTDQRRGKPGPGAFDMVQHT